MKYDYRMKDFPCYVQESGRLPEAVGERVRDLLKSFSGKKVYISIEEETTKCSLGALRYYRGVLLPAYRKLRSEWGDPLSMDDCHEAVLSEFGEYAERKGLDGIIRLTPKRSHTTDKVLSEAEFNNMCRALEVKLTQFGVVLPYHE